MLLPVLHPCPVQTEMDGSHFVGAAWRDAVPAPAATDEEAQVGVTLEGLSANVAVHAPSAAPSTHLCMLICAFLASL